MGTRAVDTQTSDNPQGIRFVNLSDDIYEYEITFKYESSLEELAETLLIVN